MSTDINKVIRNLEYSFNMNAQADDQLVDMIKGDKPVQTKPADLMLNTDDIRTILTLDNEE